MSDREYVEITEFVSGVTFRFYADRNQPHRLHVALRGVEPETAIGVYFDESTAPVWIEAKRCFETRTDAYVLAWLRMAPQHILVITCVPREQPQPE